SGRVQPARHGHSEKTTSPPPLQSCLSRIKDVSITLPQFPSLDKILRDLENQVCDAVVDRVNEHLPGNIDPWKDYNL
ncbi:hypothetical protein N5T16_27150, partial [Escherichia coli]|nr:hypothetical protein [Escherichia coli]